MIAKDPGLAAEARRAGSRSSTRRCRRTSTSRRALAARRPFDPRGRDRAGPRARPGSRPRPRCGPERPQPFPPPARRCRACFAGPTTSSRACTGRLPSSTSRSSPTSRTAGSLIGARPSRRPRRALHGAARWQRLSKLPQRRRRVVSHPRRRLRRQDLSKDRAGRRGALAGSRPAGAAGARPGGGVRHDQATQPRADQDGRPPSDGTICARKVTAHFNTGAYADIGPRLIKNGGYGDRAPTDIPTSGSTRTRSTPTCRRPARSAATASARPPGPTRRQLDMMAERLGWIPSSSG